MIFNTHKISHETWTLDMLVGIHLIMQATILRNDITIQQIKEDWVFLLKNDNASSASSSGSVKTKQLCQTELSVETRSVNWWLLDVPSIFLV